MYRDVAVPYSAVAVMAFPLVPHRNHVRLHHLCHQLVKPRLVSPAELGARLARIAKKRIDFGRPEIAGSTSTSTSPVDLSTPFSSTPLPHHTMVFARRMVLASRQHIIVGRILLQDQPHALDKIARMPPVTQGIEIAEE